MSVSPQSWVYPHLKEHLSHSLSSPREPDSLILLTPTYNHQRSPTTPLRSSTPLNNSSPVSPSYESPFVFHTKLLPHCQSGPPSSFCSVSAFLSGPSSLHHTKEHSPPPSSFPGELYILVLTSLLGMQWVTVEYCTSSVRKCPPLIDSKDNVYIPGIVFEGRVAVIVSLRCV